MDELSVKDLAALRGGETTVLVKLFDMELAHINLTMSQVLGMSIWHQMCVADMLGCQEAFRACQTLTKSNTRQFSMRSSHSAHVRSHPRLQVW